jgi:DNA topoisomerase-1
MKYIVRIRNKNDTHTYVTNDGKKANKKHIDYVKSLVIPPAYPLSVIFIEGQHDDIVSISYDEKGRKQYKYHTHFIEKNNDIKFDKLTDTIDNIQKLRNKTTRDITRKNIDAQTKEIAIIVRIILETYLRIGSDIGVRDYEHFGISTLRKKHVKIKNNSVELSFIGKKGINNNAIIRDSILVSAIRELINNTLLNDDEIFKNANALNVNTYLKDVNRNITAKSIRTYGANAEFLKEIKKIESKDIPSSERGRKIIMHKCLDKASEKLQNTRAVLKKNYIIPQLIVRFMRNPETFVNTLKKTKISTFMKRYL